MLSKLQTRSSYDYELPLVFEPLDTPIEPMIPPIRLLYSDDNNDDLSIQLQIADHQSSLSWETVLNILDDEIRLPPHPGEIVEQVTTLILMEEQITESVFKCVKLIIWSKLYKFIQAIPNVSSQLTQGELSCLWENNKDSMTLFILCEAFSSRFSSLLDQISASRLMIFTETQTDAGLSLAPPITMNLLRNIFNTLWSDQKHKELWRCVEFFSSNPADRTVSCYILILIFVSLEKSDLYSDTEPFI